MVCHMFSAIYQKAAVCQKAVIGGMSQLFSAVFQKAALGCVTEMFSTLCQEAVLGYMSESCCRRYVRKLSLAVYHRAVFCDVTELFSSGCHSCSRRYVAKLFSAVCRKLVVCDMSQNSSLHIGEAWIIS